MVFDAPAASGEGEELVLAAVFNCEKDEEKSAVQEAFKHVMTQFGIELTVVISVDSKDIAKTTSGKLQRHIVRKRFVKGEFKDALYRPEARAKIPTPASESVARDESSLEQKIAQIWSRAV